MTEKKEMMNVSGNGVALQTFADMQRFAQAAVSAGYWKDLKSVAQAVMKVQMGLELGMKPIQSFTRIHVIEGKPSLSAEAMGALVKASGKYRLVEKAGDDKAAEVAVYEKSGDGWDYLGSGRFTIQNAQEAGLKNRNNWKSYASDMLWARALSRACRRHCSDVVMGFYVPEDFNMRETSVGLEHIEPESQVIQPKTEVVKKKKASKRKKKTVEKVAIDPNDPNIVDVVEVEVVEKGEDIFGNPTSAAEVDAEAEKKMMHDGIDSHPSPPAYTEERMMF